MSVIIQRSIRLDPHNRMQQIRLNLLTLGLYFSRKYEASAAAVSLPCAALGQLGRSAGSEGGTGKGYRDRARFVCSMSASACLGTGRKITPTCLRDCARRDEKVDAAPPVRLPVGVRF